LESIKKKRNAKLLAGLGLLFLLAGAAAINKWLMDPSGFDNDRGLASQTGYPNSQVQQAVEQELLRQITEKPPQGEVHFGYNPSTQEQSTLSQAQPNAGPPSPNPQTPVKK